MEAILPTCAVVVTICSILAVISLFEEAGNRSIEMYTLNNTVYRISQHLAHISDHTGKIGDASEYLLDDPAKLAILLLKDTFLSRKDKDEGIMLVEAVEKQLKKKSRKVEHPVS